LWAIAAAIAVVTLALAVWAFWIEPREFVDRDVTLTLPNWPSTTPPLRIAILTDLHVGSAYNGIPRLKRIVADVNRRKPDAVLILGDLVVQAAIGGKFIPPERSAQELALLKSRYGTFAVLGNHDWWFDAERVGRALVANRITLLEDSSALISRPGGEVWLAGVSDFWEGRHDVSAALKNIRPGAAVVVFTHNPDVFPQVPNEVALTVAGHTHGGQVKLPFIGAPVVPSKYGQKYLRGHIIENGRHLFVSSGTGTSILPVRFGVPPEVVILTLQGRQLAQ
jgi:predicted MPP superfamily phosphohydrolase